MRGGKLRALLCICLLAAAAAARADVPVRLEELVWSMLSWNGGDYSPTFAPAAGHTVWMLAEAQNIVSLRKTFVYWWPITSEWKTDSQALNVLLPGTLEVQPAGRSGPVRRFELQSYTYFNVRGDYELNWKMVTGDAAAAEMAHYLALADAYRNALSDYEAKSAAFEGEKASLRDRIRDVQGRGGKADALVKRLEEQQGPVEPAAPRDYIVPPVPLQRGFIVNLPEGRYDAHLVGPDGSIVEGSERRIVAWKRARTGGIGYEVIPSDRWTRPEQSTTPSSVLYVNGAADLYIQPYFEDEVNDLAYEKTLDNNGRGNARISKWVRIQQVPAARVRVAEAAGAPEILSERPYYVQQAPGASLGYTIVPYEPQGAHKGKDANLKAFLVKTANARGAMEIETLDVNGRALPGSLRELRVVRDAPSAALMFALALLPVLAMTIVLVLRARTYRR